MIVLYRRFEYESTDTSREEMKRKFAPTMEFVEEYLKDVVSQPFPFGDKDKNELTLEVKQTQRIFQIRIYLLTYATSKLVLGDSLAGGESGSKPGLLWFL